MTDAPDVNTALWDFSEDIADASGIDPSAFELDGIGGDGITAGVFGPSQIAIHYANPTPLPGDAYSVDAGNHGIVFVGGGVLNQSSGTIE